MKKYLCILLWFLIPRKLAAAESDNLNLDGYLQEQSKLLYDQLVRQVRPVRQIDAQLVEPQILGSYRHEAEQILNQNIFTFFNKTFFAIGDEIFHGTLGKSFNMEFYGNFEHTSTIFFKTIEFQQTGFMALASGNEIFMYTFHENRSSPDLMQRISSPYSSDGIFFVNAGSLYFVLSTNPSGHIGLFRIYKWLDSHFDEVEKIYTTGIVKISSFPYEESEIIIVGRSLPTKAQASSYVYAFKQSKLKKIQQLKTHKPIHMNTFVQKRVPYVLIYEEFHSQKLYKFNGFEMVLVNRFQWEHNVDKSIVVYSNTIPLIVQPQLDKVLVYKLQKNDALIYKTKNYRLNYSVISDINIGENENGNITFIVGLNEDNIINIYGMSFKAHAEMEREQEETLLNCFNNLELKVYDRRKKINQMSNGRVEVPVIDEAVSTSRKRRATSNTTTNDTLIENDLEDIKNRLNNIRPLIENLRNSSNELVVNGKAVIKGNVVTKEVKANRLNFRTVNGRKWTPERWLRYNEDQKIKGLVNISRINTKILIANGDACRLFQNLLRKNGNQTISGSLKISNLFTTQILSKKINNIDVDNIYKRSDSSTIKGTKSFENISSKKAAVEIINDKNSKDIISMQQNPKITKNITFAPNVMVDNMTVESIDNINWVDFESSVFKIGIDNFIDGNLFVPQIRAVRLQAENINGIKSDHLMTTSTDQVINSTIEFNHITATSIKCTTVNDIDITKSVQVDQDGTVIKGPVSIQEVNVLNDLELIGPLSNSPFEMKGDHAFGTNETDLIQRYLGKVIIDGNLYIKDFSSLFNTTIFLNGDEYKMDVINEYWNKNGNQTIPVHFEATKGISAPHLKTKSLNEIPMEKFALNRNKTEIRSPLFFENVIVDGNVILKGDNANKSLDLPKLAFEGVRTDGKTYDIKGKKVFKHILATKHLTTKGYYNQGNESGSKSRSKILKKVLVKGNLIANISTEVINDVNITHYLANLLPLKETQNLKDIALKNVTVERLYVKTINGNSLAKYLEKLQTLLGKKQIENINIKGNLTVKQVRDLKTINGHGINETFEEDISQTDTGSDLTGDIRYNKKVKIGNLKANVINEINFPNLTRRIFYKKSNQTVTGIYTFSNLKTVHLYANHINDKNVGNIIDISSNETQQITAPNGIIFKNIKLDKSIAAEEMIPCDINKAMNSIRYPKTQEWALVEIFGNVTFLDNNCDLNQILQKSVKIDQENIILAPVVIKGHVLTDRVNAKKNINGINLSELIADVVLTDSEEEQIIKGHKIFNNLVNANVITVAENADILLINDMSIPELYGRIIRKQDVNDITISGKKTFFAGLQCNKFITDQIGGIPIEDVVSLTNLSQIPRLLFDSISVLNDLNVLSINNYDLNYILNNRLLVNTTEKQITNAVYFFNDLEILDDLRTTAINNIQVDNIVFDIKKQKITSSKQFLENINIFGNTDVKYLNSINITKAYNDALLHGKDEVINGSITILNPVKLEGNITARTINGYPIEEIKEVINRTTNKADEKAILNTRQKLDNIIQESLPLVRHMPKEFMYIERSKDLQIVSQNAIDARVTRMKDHTVLYILSEESHEKCNLPENCKCSLQHTVEIAPHHSINSILNKQQQRVYSYDDDTMIINFITNSVSRNSQCRTNASDMNNEVSNMAWASTTQGNVTGTFNVYPVLFRGYISGVEFFSINGLTYVIIARYYDAAIDTHDLDCTVLRFNEDKTEVSKIQEIPTHGVWTLYLLHTAQGITIIVGNLADKPYTEIYRFNEKIEKFELLNTISYGCTKAVGVVLGADSLIILANEDAPLQVLKYQSARDNYYYYQMFPLDEPVLGMSVFYVGGFGISEAYMCIVTEENYLIYSFQYIDGWKLETRGTIRGLRNLIPLELNNQLYLFAPSTGESSLLTVVKYGSKLSKTNRKPPNTF